MRLRLLLMGMLGFALACKGGDDKGGDDSPGADDSPGSDDSTQGDDSSGADDTSFGDVFIVTDPSVTTDFKGGWSSHSGYWIGNSSSALNATAGDTSRSQTLTVQISGNIKYAGEYPVTFIGYAEGPAQGSVDVNYNVSNPAGVTFVVEGFDEDHAYLWGHLSGSATLTDTVGGGGTSTMSTLELVSWPKF